MKQTAVEWLVQEIIKGELIKVNNGHQFIHLQSKAKEMEKGQIMQAYNDGKAAVIHIEQNMSLEEYYDKNYLNK